MRTRAELNTEWKVLMDELGQDRGAYEIGSLLAAERAIVDREIAARAIRWAGSLTQPGSGRSGRDLELLADRVESGEFEVPK